MLTIGGNVMFFIKEYVPASQIWPNAKDHKDLGYIQGYVRGYNVEVVTKDGNLDWESCEWISGTPETEFDDEYHRFRYSEWGLKPTGRISFRGYGKEVYDPDERDYYIVEVDD